MFLAFFVQFWTFLLILNNFRHFLHIFCVLEVLCVLFCKLSPSLITGTSVNYLLDLEGDNN